MKRDKRPGNTRGSCLLRQPFFHKPGLNTRVLVAEIGRENCGQISLHLSGFDNFGHVMLLAAQLKRSRVTQGVAY